MRFEWTKSKYFDNCKTNNAGVIKNLETCNLLNSIKRNSLIILVFLRRRGLMVVTFKGSIKYTMVSDSVLHRQPGIRKVLDYSIFKFRTFSFFSRAETKL